MSKELSRRSFLRYTGALGASLGVGAFLAACGGEAVAPTNTVAPSRPPASAAPASAAAGGAASAAPSAAASAVSSTAASAAPASAAASAAAASTAPSAAASFSGKLLAWGIVSFTTDGDKLLGDQMMAWGKENKVEVEYVALPGSDYDSKVAAAVETGAIPDVVMMGGTNSIYYAGQNRLADVTDVFTKVNRLGGGMWASILPNVQVGDKTYSIPMQADLSVLYARLDLCEEATGKRAAPTTLDEMDMIMRKINKPPTQFGYGFVLGRTPDGSGDIQSMLLADGGTLVDKDGNPAIDNPGTISALTRVQTWWKDKLIPPDSPAWDDSSNNKSYQSRQACFVTNPASIFAFLEANDKELLAQTTQAPYPKGKVGSFPGAGTWAWSVFSASKQVPASKAMIENIMTPEKVQAVYEKVGGRWYPVYKDLANAKWWKDRPYFDNFPQGLESARPSWFPATATPKLLSQLSAVGQKRILAEMSQDVIVNNKSPEEAAKAAQTKMVQTFAEIK